MAKVNRVGRTARGAGRDGDGQCAERNIAEETRNATVQPGGGIFAGASGRNKSRSTEAGRRRERHRLREGGRTVQRHHHQAQTQDAQGIPAENLRVDGY